mgnify:CR=1 FL=1
MASIGLIYDRIRWEEKALINASKKAGLELKSTDAKRVQVNPLEGAAVLEEAFGGNFLRFAVWFN